MISIVSLWIQNCVCFVCALACAGINDGWLDCDSVGLEMWHPNLKLWNVRNFNLFVNTRIFTCFVPLPHGEVAIGGVIMGRPGSNTL